MTRIEIINSYLPLQRVIIVLKDCSQIDRNLEIDLNYTNARDNPKNLNNRRGNLFFFFLEYRSPRDNFKDTFLANIFVVRESK